MRAGRRRGVVGLVAAMAAWGAFWGAWAAVLPAIKAQVGASEAELGLSLLAIAAGALPALLLAGRLVDRFGDRALVASLAAFAVAATLPGLAESVPLLAVALLVLGAASGALDVALNWGLATFEARQGRRVFNAAHAAFPLAVVVSAPAAGLAREQALSPAAILAAVAAITLLTIPLNVVHRGTRVVASAAGPRARPSRSLLRLGVLAGVVLLVENAVEQWSSLHLEEGLDAGPPSPRWDPRSTSRPSSSAAYSPRRGAIAPPVYARSSPPGWRPRSGWASSRLRRRRRSRWPASRSRVLGWRRPFRRSSARPVPPHPTGRAGRRSRP